MTNLDPTQAKIAAIKATAEILANQNRRVDSAEVAEAAKAAYKSAERNS